MLKKRVLDVAVQEINEKTDINLSYELQRQGRKVLAIHLFVQAKKGKQTPQNTSSAIKQKLKAFGIKDQQIEALIAKRDEQYLWANIAIVEEEHKKGKISNVTAYLMKAFEVDFRPIETEHDRVKKLKAEERFEKSKRAALEQEQRNGLLKRFEQQKMQAVSKVLNSLKAEEIEALKAEFLAGIQANPLFKKMLDTKGFESATIQSYRHNFIAQKHLPKTAYSFDEFLKESGEIDKNIE